MHFTLRHALAATSLAGLAACTSVPPAGVLQATYTIDGAPITLRDGRAERAAAPGSASLERFTVQDGSVVSGDLDGDGNEDAALVLVHESAGSGTFRYLASAVVEAGRWQGSDALFLGDRIGPPTLAIRDGVIEARFLDRPRDASFDQPPTQARVVRARRVGTALEALDD